MVDSLLILYHFEAHFGAQREEVLQQRDEALGRYGDMLRLVQQKEGERTEQPRVVVSGDPPETRGSRVGGGTNPCVICSLYTSPSPRD